MSNLLSRFRREGEGNLPDPADDSAAPPAIPTKGGAATATFTLRDLLLVTYAVAPDKVRPLVPEGLPLDILPTATGETVAFVQTLCAWQEDGRWSVLPAGMGQSFHQIVYRVLTRREGQKGAWAYRTYLSQDETRLASRAISRDTEFARFAAYIAGDPARGTYQSYTVRATGGEAQTHLAAPALPAAPDPLPAPFARPDDLLTFLADRPDTYFRASAPKTGVGVVHADLPDPLPPPTWATLTTARLSPWVASGVLKAETALLPHSVLVLPSVRLLTRPPRYAKGI